MSTFRRTKQGPLNPQFLALPLRKKLENKTPVLNALQPLSLFLFTNYRINPVLSMVCSLLLKLTGV